MPRPITTDIWSDWECAGGTRLARVPLDHYLDLDVTRRLTGDHELTCGVSKSAPSYDKFQSDRVLRLVYDDPTYDREWRLHTLNDASGLESDVGVLRMRATSPIMDLRDYTDLQWTTAGVVSLTKTYDGVTLTQLFTDLLLQAPTYWTLGTIAPTVVVSITVAAGSTVLEVMRAGVAAAIAEGVSCEMIERRNGSTGYYVDVSLEIGAGAGTPDIRGGKNLLGMRRQRTIEPVAQKVIVLGENDITLARAFLRIASVSGSDVELRIPETGTAAVLFDDQFNNLYLARADGTYVQITDSVAATSKVTLSALGTCAQHDLVRIVADSAGKDQVSLAKPGSSRPRRRVLRLSHVGTDHNILRNPYCSYWPGSSSAPPDGYSSVIGTVTRNTDPTYIRRGSYSCQVASTSASWSGTDYLLRTPTQDTLPGYPNAYNVRVSLYLAAGNILVKVQDKNGNLIASDGTSTVGWWEREWLNLAPTNSSVRLELHKQSQNTTIYFDACQAAPGAASVPWTLGCEASSLHSRGNLYLEDNHTEAKSFTINLADWQKVAPAEFPYDTLDLGLTARVRDVELNETFSARIVELRERLRRPAESSVVVLSTSPSDFVRRLALKEVAG